MWGRLKRRILRSKGRGQGGGVYNSSSHEDDGFSNTRDTYRDFREELYDDSRGSGSSWKETGGGGKPGKRMSLTKTTPFPNLDRCSCGTPGGRDLQENVAKSETLRRKNDFILGVDSKSWSQTKGRVTEGKVKNDYTSTSTGPGSRGRALQDGGGGELRLRASTSTGQIPCSGEEFEDRTRNVWSRHRRCIPGGPGRRLAYSDDEEIDDDDESEEEEVEDEEDEEEDSAEEGEEEEEEEVVARVPSTSQTSSFRNSGQSDATKSSSNSSDYTSLAFDLNYVKVSPPKLRPRRRKKNSAAAITIDDKSSCAPLMVRRERRPFPEVTGSSTSSDRLPPPSSRATESKRPVAESGCRDETITSVGGIVRLDGSDQGHPPRVTSKDGDAKSSPTKSKGDASCRQPVQALFSPRKQTKQEQNLSSGYVSWADIHNPSMSSIDGSRNTSEVSGLSERTVVEERVKEEETAAAAVAGKKRGSCGEISTSGSVLQFTFTVRIDNDVFRGTRRDVERTNEAAASGSGSGLGPAGSSLVSGRVDILNQEQKHAEVAPTAVGVDNVLDQDKQHHHHHQQATYNTGNEALSLVQRSFKVQLHDKGARADGGQSIAPSQEAGKVMLAESANVTTDPSDGIKAPTTAPSVPQQQVPQTAGDGGNGLDRITKTGSVVPGVGGRQRTLEDFFVSSNQGSNQGSRMTTVAIVHKSASDHGDDVNVASLSRNELGPTDGRDAYVKSGDLVGDAKAGPPPPRKTFDEVDSCIAVKPSKSHQSQPPPSSPPPVAEDGAELTHMSWDEVMREAESLGIPLSRPSQHPGGCSNDRTRHPSTSTDHQVLTSASSPPPKQGASFQDVYWVCSSCTEAMQNQSSRKTHQQSYSKTTSSPFKEKFKLQSIFGVSGSGGKKPKGGEERTTCKGQGTSSPINRKSQSPGTKYKTMPIPAGTAAAVPTTKDVVLWGGHNCSCSTTRRSAQTSRQRSLSPVSSTRCSQAVHSSSPKAEGHWGRGGDRRGQRVSHLCSPPLLRCRFSSTGRTLVGGPAPSMTLMKSAHLSSEMLTSSSSPVKRRANDNDRDFLKSLAQLMGCSWYWGTLSFEAAEAELVDRPDGAFLVRDSSDDRYILSVSFRSQRSTHHVRIERHNGMFSFSAEHGLHESSDIVNFIENAVEWSQTGQCLYYLRPRQLNSAPVPVQLIYPVSRFAH